MQGAERSRQDHRHDSDRRGGTQDPGNASPVPPLSLYVHIPWCLRKCPYCDFNSHAQRRSIPEDAYIDALLQDLEQDLASLDGAARPLHSLFIGGGTPSLFSASAVARLLNGVRARVDCEAAMEITLEANPGTLETDRFAAYREAGVNRLSLGVQSLSGEKLRCLGRIHGPVQAVAAVRRARQAGFGNLNLDLMFGLPRQSLSEALDDIRGALALQPDHLSYYQLTLEPDTAFFNQPPPLPAADLVADMQLQAQELIAAAGFGHYEVSAYAQPGRLCRHNLNYWQFGDYLGIGAGAHGKLTRRPNGSVERRWKFLHPEDYLRNAAAGRFVAGRRRLEPADLLLEFMMNGLRLHQGFTRSLFEGRTGLAFARVEPLVREAVARELLIEAGEHLRPSALGRRFLNDLLALFMTLPTARDELCTG